MFFHLFFVFFLKKFFLMFSGMCLFFWFASVFFWFASVFLYAWFCLSFFLRSHLKILLKSQHVEFERLKKYSIQKINLEVLIEKGRGTDEEVGVKVKGVERSPEAVHERPSVHSGSQLSTAPVREIKK